MLLLYIVCKQRKEIKKDREIKQIKWLRKKTKKINENRLRESCKEIKE